MSEQLKFTIVVGIFVLLIGLLVVIDECDKRRIELEKVKAERNENIRSN